MLTPRIAALLTLPPLLWAGNAVVGRLAVGSVPPLMLNALRWSLVALLLLPLGWRALRRPGEILARWRELSVLGMLGVGAYNALQYLALVTSTPINVTLIAASMPLWMLLVGAFVYHTHPSRRQVLGAVLSLTGVLLVIARGQPSALLRVHFVTGDLYILVAIVCWAFYSWQLARPPARLRAPERPAWDWAEFMLLQTLFGLPWTYATSTAEQIVGAAPIAWNGWVVAALAYVAVGPSIIAYRCWGLGVAQAGPAVAAFFGNLAPLFAALLSAIVLHEAPQWFHAAAFGLIVGGILVSTGRRVV